MNSIEQLAAKIRNLFQPAELKSRNDDGSLKILTAYSRTIDGVKESFPYGFCAKAKKGSLVVFCAGGSLDAVKVFPVENSDNIPALGDGDVCIYTSEKNYVICRAEGGAEVVADGNVLIRAKNGNVTVEADSTGKLYIGNAVGNLASLLCSLADDVLSQLKTQGSSTAQSVDPSTVTSVNAWKKKVQRIFHESGGSDET